MTRLEAAVAAADREVEKQRADIERNERICSQRVLDAFADNRISEAHLLGTTGYGYGDLGRDALEKVYAQVYHAEDALVRIQLVSGTHAISTALHGVLRPGDRVLTITGKPYDTIMPTIGEKADGSGSLADFGISFDYGDVFSEGEAVFDRLKSGYKMAYIQRSRGYSLRRSLTTEEIDGYIEKIRAVSPDTVVFVDNCYGEFVCESEPKADLLAGSLIKNAGGGLCPCGGYIAGKTALVEKCADRLTAVGIGKEVGASLFNNRSLYMGLFMAPHTTSQNLLTAVFAASLLRELGFEVSPEPNEKRGDIVQLLMLGGTDNLISFCRGLQAGSPIDSFVTPEPWDMPGYDSKVIMAAGGFISGSSTEISADAPLREPYCVWMQGGLTYATGRSAVIKAAQAVINQ